MQTTTNYGFNKPDKTEKYNVEQFNENFETIDTELKAAVDKAESSASHPSDKENPHGVTAEQVGLGNVPNVATNDQTPTYTVASENAALSSGEKLSVAFGKIAKAISSLISHLADSVSHVTSTERTAWNAKADASHGTHVTFSTTAPVVAGTAAVGSATTVSRSDHVHPAQTTVSGNAGSATKLATARTIDGVSFNGSAAIIHYGTCSTAAATAAKTVALTSFTLVTGAWVAVKFTVTNTASSPTLNVNSTGAKSIMYRGSAISAGYLAANRVYLFVYDGTDWELVGDINTDTNTTYTLSTITGTLAVAKGGTGATTAAEALTNIGAAASSHTHAASGVTAGTLAGKVLANATSSATVTDKQVRNIYAGTTDMTAGTTALTSGDIYVFYE